MMMKYFSEKEVVQNIIKQGNRDRIVQNKTEMSKQQLNLPKLLNVRKVFKSLKKMTLGQIQPERTKVIITSKC